MITNPDGYLKTCDPQEPKRECQCIQMAETNRMLRQELQELDPDELVEENERLTRRVEALEKVLKPFQAVYEKLVGLPPTADVIIALYQPSDTTYNEGVIVGTWGRRLDFTKIGLLQWDQLKAVVKI